MSLPKLQILLYEATLPSGLKVSFRPFLVKEEKLLLMAKQSDDAQTMITAVHQVLSNCLESTNVQVEKLSLFDLEFLFLHLMARSIGETVPLRYRCNRMIDEKLCGMISTYPVDLLKISPSFGEGHSKTIALTKTEGLTMQYPTFKSFRRIAKEDLPPDEAYSVVLDCIESIYDSKGVYPTKDAPREEIQEFVDSLSALQVKKIDQFFDTMPKIKTTIPFHCPKCDNKEEINIEGLDAFFV